MTIPFREPFPGALRQRCVKCESAAESAVSRRIDTGRWAIVVKCLNDTCLYTREIDVPLDKLEDAS